MNDIIEREGTEYLVIGALPDAAEALEPGDRVVLDGLTVEADGEGYKVLADSPAILGTTDREADTVESLVERCADKAAGEAGHWVTIRGRPIYIQGKKPSERAINPRSFVQKNGKKLEPSVQKMVAESNAESQDLEDSQPDRAVYFLTERDLGKVGDPNARYSSARAYLDEHKKKLGKAYGLKCRDAAASAMKTHPDYLRGLGQGRLDNATKRDYSEERGLNFYNLGYYRGYTDYKRDKRGGLKIEIPQTKREREG